MATFYNQATLSYNGNTTTSNITTGELVEVLSANKTAVVDTYTANDRITYVINIINSGLVPYTNLTLTDNLGSYQLGAGALVPLTYVPNSVLYYVNGVLQTAPTVVGIPELVISGINVPANGNATIIYEAATNSFAPLDTDGTITNQAVISGDNLSSDIEVTETVSTADTADLTISKALSPNTVSENGQLTYTFVIQNTGNTPATAADNVVVTDTFNPILNPITVTFNGTTWTEDVHYTYNTTTGLFTSIAGQITVPAATYSQNPTVGNWITNPGVSTLVITGTV